MTDSISTKSDFDAEEFIAEVCLGQVEESINKILDRNYYDNLINDDISKILRGALSAHSFEKI